MDMKPTRAAIYARISDDPEGKAAGVTRQIEDCTALIERIDWTMGPWEPFIDNDIGASTKTAKGKRRYEYERLVSLVESGEIDGVVFYSNSRLTRRPKEFEDWIELVERTGVQLASVVSGRADLSTADGRMIARVLAAQDAAEAERISERVKRANVQRRTEGRPEPSSRAFGFEKGGEIVREDEAVLIREAVRHIIDDGWSMGMVVNDWNRRKIPTVRGGEGWSRVAVKRALTSPRTAGLLSLKGEVIGPGQFTGIISPEDRELALKAISARQRNGGTSFKQRQHVLAGFMVCGRCGKPMKVNALYAEDGSYRKDSYIVCSRSQFGCGNVKRNFLHVMGYIDGVIRNRIETFEPMGEAEITGEVEDQVKELEARLREVEEDIADLKAAFNAREIRFRDYNSDLATLRTQQELLEKAIGEAATRATVDPEVDLLATWEDGSVEEKRAVLEWCIDHITLHPIGRVGPFKALELVPTATEITFRS